MKIVRLWIRIALNNNNLSIQKNTYSLDLYDYVNRYLHHCLALLNLK